MRVPVLRGGLLLCSTNLKAIGEGRTQMLDVNLENIAKRMGDSASGKSTVDPKGYLTSLDSIQLSSDAEIGDIKKARMLLKSVINTNPKHAPGWVAAARLEETVGYVPWLAHVLSSKSFIVFILSIYQYPCQQLV